MKAPATIETAASAPGTGAAIVAAAGALPGQKNTVRAEVLSRLLAGERLTGLDAVFSASTTRLSAVIHALAGYGWDVSRTSLAVGCKDGRTVSVTQYHLRQSIISAAQRNGAAAWCADVRAARAERRSNAADAQRRAELCNAACSECTSAPPSAEFEMFRG